MAPLLHIDPPRPPGADQDETGHYALPGGRMRSNSLLGIVSSRSGPAAHLTFDALQNEALDRSCRHFLTEAEAKACRERFAGRGEKTVIVPLASGVFSLVAAEHVFGSSAAAEQAANKAGAIDHRRLIVMPHGDGFVLISSDLVAGAT